jgi:pentatricopeptide repeat protein
MVQQRGIAPSSTVANETMDCLGKSGLVDDAFAFFERSITQGVAPSLHTFSILIKACAVAQQAERAHAVVEKLMPAHGIEPTVATWNNLLAASQGMDGAYATWQRMVASGIIPDVHTERQLAAVFASNPFMALELVMEARNLSSSSSKTCSKARYSENAEAINTGDAGNHLDTSRAAAASRQAPLQLDQNSDTPMNDSNALFEKYLEPLDLHGHSQAAARVALLRRLEMLVKASEDLCLDSRKDRKLVIITGVGHGSAEGVGVLKVTVRRVLAVHGVEAPEAEENPGRLEICWSQLETFLGTQRQQMERDRVLVLARARYSVVFAGLCVVGAASFIVPRMLPWMQSVLVLK